jgi:hypothetical protein
MWLTGYTVMVIIGVPLFRTVYNLLSLVEGPYRFLTIMMSFYELLDPFMIKLLLLSQVVTAFVNLCRLPELFDAYCSPSLALRLRREGLVDRLF